MVEENGEIEIGDKFFSYEELESKIRLYELRKNYKFYKRDSRKISSARKKGIKRDYKLTKILSATLQLHQWRQRTSKKIILTKTQTIFFTF